MSGFSLIVDLPALLTALFAALCCGLMGNFLVLQHRSLLGDALSHSVFPGMVAFFLLTGSIALPVMGAGALLAALLAVALVELIRRLTPLEPGAVMGIVFTTFFALGVTLLEITESGNVHLDVDHALFGNLESGIWPGLSRWGDLWHLAAWQAMPPALAFLMMATGLIALIVLLFYKELKLLCFDPLLAGSLGFRPSLLQMILMLCVALACVAAFRAAGAILVVALLICPAAAARLLTQRMGWQIGLSLCFAAFSALGGYAMAALLPAFLGFDHLSLSAAGSITSLSGLILLMAILYALSLRRARPAQQDISENKDQRNPDHTG